MDDSADPAPSAAGPASPRRVTEFVDLGADEAQGFAARFRADQPQAAIAVRPQTDGRWSVRVELDQAPDGLQRAAASARLAENLGHAARSQGVDPDLLGALGWVDSRFTGHATVPARLFGFGRGTWRGLVERHGAATGITEPMIALGSAQCTMAAVELRENGVVLRNGLGRQPGGVDCQLARLIGPQVAVAVLRAEADEPVDGPLRRYFAATPLGAGHTDRILDALAALLRDVDGAPRPISAVTGFLRRRLDEGLREARRLYATAASALPNAADPPWLRVARREIGPHEIDGGTSPRIERYFAAAEAGRPDDAIPWCGAFVSYCLREAGRIDLGPVRATDWLGWGARLDAPRLGCVVVLKAQADAAAGGHVGFLAGSDGERLLLLGANQTDEVRISAYPRGELCDGGLRWPNDSA